MQPLGYCTSFIKQVLWPIVFAIVMIPVAVLGLPFLIAYLAGCEMLGKKPAKWTEML